jgi:hypothetical protein
MVILNASSSVPATLLLDGVRIIEPQPWGASRLRTQNQRVTDTVRPLRRLLDAADRKFRNNARSHLKAGVIKNQERLMVIGLRLYSYINITR